MSTEDQNTLRRLTAGLLFVFLVSLGIYCLTFSNELTAAEVSRRSVATELRVTATGRAFIDEEGQVVCWGHLKNETGRPVRDILVMVPCYDSAGRLTGYARARNDFLAPGGSWIFRARSWAFPMAASVGQPRIVRYH